MKFNVPDMTCGHCVATITKALRGVHHLAVNVSDARAYVTVEGAGAAEVMAKNAPVDFSAAAFGAGDFRRSRVGQVAAAFWKDEAGAFHVVSFRSVGDYVFDLLRVSAEAGPVGALS